MDQPPKAKLTVAHWLASAASVVAIFLAAGTIHYWQAWLFYAVFAGASSWHGLYIMKNAPGLLERRLRAGPSFERRPTQRIIMSFLPFSFVALLVVAGLDHRLGWSNLSTPVVLAADAVVILCFAFFNIICRENTFASATIEVADGQKVISSGPYAFVRHPMYSGALLLSLAMPIALGSLWAVLTVLAIVPVLIWRIVDEEKFLRGSLEGYTEYCQKVKYRLIPGIY